MRIQIFIVKTRVMINLTSFLDQRYQTFNWSRTSFSKTFLANMSWFSYDNNLLRYQLEKGLIFLPC